MPTLRLLAAGATPAGQTGELLSCAYTPDGAFVLSGGWDGHLRLWETGQGSHVTAFTVSDKPVSACTVSPDGKTLVSGSLDGMLGLWDALTHHQKTNYLAHTRPVSGISYAPDNKTLATSSWDSSVNVWHGLRSHDYRALAGHRDIVAGCQFSPDGTSVLSWSHDKSVFYWDIPQLRPKRELVGHNDRVLAGSLSADGQWAATGGRDGVLKLWDLNSGMEAGSVNLRGEVRGCPFLLDGASLLAVDHQGRLTLHALPSLAPQGELISRAAVNCCAMSPTGNQVALACGDGKIHLVAIDGFDQTPLLVGATRTTKRVASTLQKLFGRSNLLFSYQCVCPVCRHVSNLGEKAPAKALKCPACKRSLQYSGVLRVLSEVDGK